MVTNDVLPPSAADKMSSKDSIVLTITPVFGARKSYQRNNFFAFLT